MKPVRSTPLSLLSGIVALLFAMPAFAAEAATPSNEELYRILQDQEKRIEKQDETIQDLNEKLEATGEAVEQVQESQSATGSGRNWWERTTIGSYGEMHYNRLDNSRGKDQDILDFHRFVLFVGHEFTDDIRFFSELEVEHAFVAFDDDDNDLTGEVELEQAYIQMDLYESQDIRAHVDTGIFLVPIGILNDTHEPPTFYGVERNPVETRIIPSTWWEGGGKLTGQFSHGITLDLAVHSGLKMSDFSIRGGRQKVSKADASNPAITGRIAWRGIPGVELATTVQWQDDVNDGGDLVDGSSTQATLIETHLNAQKNGFGLRALFAYWDIDSGEARSIGRDEQYGFYVEPSYRFWEDKLGVFGRYSRWNTAAGGRGASELIEEWSTGMNYWPHPNVVFKFDYQWQDAANGISTQLEGFNFGVGYQF